MSALKSSIQPTYRKSRRSTGVNLNMLKVLKVIRSRYFDRSSGWLIPRKCFENSIHNWCLFGTSGSRSLVFRHIIWFWIRGVQQLWIWYTILCTHFSDRNHNGISFVNLYQKWKLIFMWFEHIFTILSTDRTIKNNPIDYDKWYYCQINFISLIWLKNPIFLSQVKCQQQPWHTLLRTFEIIHLCLGTAGRPAEVK